MLTFLCQYTVTFFADVTFSYIRPADSGTFQTSYGSVLFIRPHRRQHGIIVQTHHKGTMYNSLVELPGQADFSVGTLYISRQKLSP